MERLIFMMNIREFHNCFTIEIYVAIFLLCNVTTFVINLRKMICQQFFFRLGYSEVELVQCMIDGVNALYEEDLELQKKHAE